MPKWLCSILGHRPAQFEINGRKFTKCFRCKSEWEGWEEKDFPIDPYN